MKQHPWLSLAFTLGTGRFLSLKQTYPTNLQTTKPGDKMQSTSVQVEDRPSSPTRKGTRHCFGRQAMPYSPDGRGLQLLQ